MVRTDCHTKLFSPFTSVKTPCFYQKLSPKVLYFFHTVQNFGNFSLKDPKLAGIWEKKLCPYFYGFCHWRTPISCLACTYLRGMLLPQTRSAEAGKFCILETESYNLVNTLRCKLNFKVMKTKFQFYRLNRPICTLWMNFIGGQGWYTGHHPSGQTWKGIYPTTTLCMTVRNLAL